MRRIPLEVGHLPGIPPANGRATRIRWRVAAGLSFPSRMAAFGYFPPREAALRDFWLLLATVGDFPARLTALHRISLEVGHRPGIPSLNVRAACFHPRTAAGPVFPSNSAAASNIAMLRGYQSSPSAAAGRLPRDIFTWPESKKGESHDSPLAL